MPTVTSYSNARATLATLCDEVSSTREPVIIRRRGAADVALVSADELASLLETAHLLRSPKNAERLLKALSRAGSAPGESAKTGLAEPDSHHPPPGSFRASARSSFAPRRRLIMMVAHSGSVTGDLRLSRTARYVSRGSRHASTSAPAAASEREVPMWTTSSARSTCVSS